MQKVERHIKSIVFDLGHTLIFFVGDRKEVNYASYLVLADELIKGGCRIDREIFSQRFRELMEQYYLQRDNDLLELPVHQLVEKALSEFDQSPVSSEQISMAMKKMYIYTGSHWQTENDTLATLTSLRESGYKLGLISNASDAWDVNNLLDDNHLREYFSVILISADEGIRKPNPRIFKKAASQMGVSPSEIVMVGDKLDADILGAQQSGMKAIWISRYYGNLHDRPDLSTGIRPDAEIRSLSELPDLLAKW